MPDSPAIACRRRKRKKKQVAAGHERVRQAALLKPDRAVASQGRIADPAEHAEIDDVIVAEPVAPFRKLATQPVRDSPAAVQLDPVPLAVIETDRLDQRETGER